MRWQCTRCEEAGEVCKVNPVGVCQRCKSRKLGCSLMPDNPATGKTDRRAKSKQELFQYRKEQADIRAQAKQEEVAKRAKVKIGKQRARNSADSGEAEASASASPLELAGLRTLTLESGDSSAANTPADSPGALLQPPSPRRPSRHIPKRLAGEFVYRLSLTAPALHSTGMVLKVPAAPQLLETAHRQVSHSRGDASQASEAGDNASRIAALERKQDALERKQTALEEENDQLKIRVRNLERRMEQRDA